MDQSSWYRNQSWLIRRWRDRYLFLVPYQAVRMWFREILRPESAYEDLTFRPMSWSNCWSVARGYADLNRKNLMTWQELKDEL